MSRKILIAVPAYCGQVNTPTVMAIDGSKEEGRRRGWEVRSKLYWGTADLADTRNQIIGEFRHTDCDDLLMVDGDVSWGPGNFDYIMSHHVDFVAGLYRERTDYRVHYPAEWPAERRGHIDPVTGRALIAAISVPAGFLRVTRNCIEMMAHRDNVHWVQDPNKINGIRYPFLFDWAWVKEGEQLRRKSEDFSFCCHWRDVGGTVWVDPALKLHHTGPKTYEGDFAAFLQSDVINSPATSRDAARSALALVS